MAEERKTDEALEKAVETDEDIDRYIRELTGKETPKDKEKKAEEKKAPEKEEFRVTSQIGEDDYKAFIYYSTLGALSGSSRRLSSCRLCSRSSLRSTRGIFTWAISFYRCLSCMWRLR